MGAQGYCSPEISDALTLVELPNGLVIPKSMLPKPEIVVEFADKKEEREFQEYMAEQKRLKDQKTQEEKTRRAEINRKIARNKRKEQDGQLSLFDDP